MAFRQWLNDKAGGDVGWVGGATSRDLPPARTRQQLLSRWERHTKDCASCKQVIPRCVIMTMNGFSTWHCDGDLPLMMAL